MERPTLRPAMKNLFLIPLLMVLLSGCANLPYYFQAAQGQWELFSKEQPISHLIANPDTHPRMKEQLMLAQKLSRFARETLLLPTHGSYEHYVNLERPFATWVVFTTPEFSLTPLQWCFPFTGCLGYRGYFKEADAQQFATSLKDKHHDIYVGGSPAYSTLGWFDDPLLNTFISWPEARLASLIFHELAHQKLYIPGETAFNESYAEAVSQVGVVRWLENHHTSEALEKWQSYQKKRANFLHIIQKIRAALKKLYDSPRANAVMRTEKKRLLDEGCLELKNLQEPIDKKTPTLAFCTGLNNAKLASVNLYAKWVGAFQKLYQQVGFDMAAFHETAARIGRLEQKQRTNHLSSLTKANPKEKKKRSTPPP